MTVATNAAPSSPVWASLREAGRQQGVWLVALLVLVGVTAIDPEQGRASTVFAAGNLAQTAPYLVLSIGLAAYAGATGADRLIARAFSGSPHMMIVLAALAGALSPFCSCGVIPLIGRCCPWGCLCPRSWRSGWRARSWTPACSS